MLRQTHGLVCALVLLSSVSGAVISSPAMAKQHTQELLSESAIPESYRKEYGQAQSNGVARVRFIAPSRIVGITDNGGGKSNTAAELLIVGKTGVSHENFRRDALNQAVGSTPEVFLKEINIQQRKAGLQELEESALNFMDVSFWKKVEEGEVDMAVETLDSELYQLPRLAPATRRLLIEKKIAYYKVVFQRMEKLYPTRESLRHGLTKLGFSVEEVEHVIAHRDLIKRDGSTLAWLRWGSEPFLSVTYKGGGIIWNRRVVSVTGKTFSGFTLPGGIGGGFGGRYEREHSGGGFPNTPPSGSGGSSNASGSDSSFGTPVSSGSTVISSDTNSISTGVHKTPTSESSGDTSSLQTPSADTITLPGGDTSFVPGHSNETTTEVKKVPEPSTVIGIVAAGALGLFLKRTRR